MPGSTSYLISFFFLLLCSLAPPNPIFVLLNIQLTCVVSKNPATFRLVSVSKKALKK